MIRISIRPLLAALCAGLLAVPAVRAAEPVRHIGIYVTPYYEAARDAGGAPKVAVAKAYDALLASNRAEDVARARDEIAKNNALLTPMTLMVLAIRLYDVGRRDDAVFWFYAAKNRYLTLDGVADVRAPQLAQVEDAVKSFATLAGPVINGYAFCDIANQQKIAARALQWTIDNPYKALFLPQVPARPGDRAQNLAKAIAGMKANGAKERDYLANAENVARFRQQRKENEADRKFCWK
ncbi:MAG: cytochrome-c oxidase [Betaproteobacteria bacterium]|nr:cytochrome-c oxidase [Betaproteobacteria bacterium]MCC7216300.1 hypothetical protein [Burkholderiales bacterium]